MYPPFFKAYGMPVSKLFLFWLYLQNWVGSALLNFCVAFPQNGLIWVSLGRYSCSCWDKLNELVGVAYQILYIIPKFWWIALPGKIPLHCCAESTHSVLTRIQSSQLTTCWWPVHIQFGHICMHALCWAGRSNKSTKLVITSTFHSRGQCSWGQSSEVWFSASQRSSV